MPRKSWSRRHDGGDQDSAGHNTYSEAGTTGAKCGLDMTATDVAPESVSEVIRSTHLHTLLGYKFCRFVVISFPFRSININNFEPPPQGSKMALL